MPPSLPLSTLDGFAFLPAPDPLWRCAPTPYAARFHLLGVPLEFATNAPVLMTLAQELFYGGMGQADGQAVRLRVFLHDEEEAENSMLLRPLYRIQEGYFLVSLGRSLGFSDFEAGYASAFVTTSLLQSGAGRRFVQDTFLECLALYLAFRQRPIRLHAAAVAWEGRGLLLTGADGAGKSTLAYACLQQGFDFISEDVVFAESAHSPFTVWANPRRLHLLPDAVRLFPELTSAEEIRQTNGEKKLRIAIPRKAATECHPVQGVLSLSRATGPESRIREAEPDRVRHALTYFEGDPPVDPRGVGAAADRLLRGRIAHMEVGRDLLQAVATVRQWLEADP